MKSVLSLLAAGALLCLPTTTALAQNDTSPSQARRDHSLLSIWDKPAFSPAPYTGQVPWLDSHATKGQHIDFLLSPEVEKLGPLVAQRGSSPEGSDAGARRTN